MGLRPTLGEEEDEECQRRSCCSPDWGWGSGSRRLFRLRSNIFWEHIRERQLKLWWKKTKNIMFFSAELVKIIDCFSGMHGRAWEPIGSPKQDQELANQKREIIRFVFCQPWTSGWAGCGLKGRKKGGGSFRIDVSHLHTYGWKKDKNCKNIFCKVFQQT